MKGFKEFVLEDLAAPDTMAEYGNDDNTTSFKQKSMEIIRDRRIIVDKNNRQKKLIRRMGDDNTKNDELTAYDRQNTPT